MREQSRDSGERAVPRKLPIRACPLPFGGAPGARRSGTRNRREPPRRRGARLGDHERLGRARVRRRRVAGPRRRGRDGRHGSRQPLAGARAARAEEAAAQHAARGGREDPETKGVSGPREDAAGGCGRGAVLGAADAVPAADAAGARGGGEAAISRSPIGDRIRPRASAGVAGDPRHRGGREKSRGGRQAGGTRPAQRDAQAAGGAGGGDARGNLRGETKRLRRGEGNESAGEGEAGPGRAHRRSAGDAEEASREDRAVRRAESRAGEGDDSGSSDVIRSECRDGCGDGGEETTHRAVEISPRGERQTRRGPESHARGFDGADAGDDLGRG